MFVFENKEIGTRLWNQDKDAKARLFLPTLLTSPKTTWTQTDFSWPKNVALCSRRLCWGGQGRWRAWSIHPHLPFPPICRIGADHKRNRPGSQIPGKGAYRESVKVKLTHRCTAPCVCEWDPCTQTSVLKAIILVDAKYLRYHDVVRLRYQYMCQIS